MTQRKKAHSALEQRLAQQAAVAALGQAALAQTSVGTLMNQVVHCVAETLGTEFAKVLELAPGGRVLLLRAGVGWTPGLVGRATVGAGRDSQAGFTLLEDRPVVVTDLRTETRFTGPPLLLDHGVVSGMSCAIRGADGRPYGILGIHTRSRREFSDGDVDFLRSVANVLAAAIGRLKVEEQMREAESHLAGEVDALARLNELSSRLWQMPGLSEGLEEMLHATVALLGADKANIQLLHDRVLRIAAQHGFDRAFLDYFREVTVEDHSACARALRSGGVVVIDDVDTDEQYAPMRTVAREAGYRAVLSTPLIARDGGTLGIVSVHFQSPHRPNDQELQRLTLYVRQAADFIERCRGEQGLRESEQRYRRVSEQLRLVTDTMAAPVTLCSRDLRYVWVSTTYAAWLGRAPHEIVGRPIIDIIGADAFEKLLPFFKTVLSGQQVRYEEEVEFKGVGRRWISATYTPTFDSADDAAGEPDGWVAVVLDIDQRTRMEQALRDSEARQAFLVRLDDALRPLADTTGIQNAAARVLGEYLRATRAMYADVEGEPGAEFGTIRSRYQRDSAEELAPFPERYAYSVFGGGVMGLRRRGETIVVADVTTDPAFGASEREAWVGSGVCAAVTVSLVKDGRLVADLSVQSATARAWTAQEIALVEATAERTWAAVERARAEEKLREAEAQSRRFLDYHQAVMAHMGEGLYTLDPQGLVTYVNPAAERLLGFKRPELLGRRMHDMIHYQHRDGTPFPLEDCAKFQVLHQGAVVSDHEDVFIRRDGTFFDVLYSSAPVVFEGNAIGVVVVFRDVTDRKRAEEALRETEARLMSLFDALPLGVGVIDADGNLVVANREMGRYMPNRMIPSGDDTISWRWRATHADGRRVDPADYPGARALRGERVVPGIEFRYTRDDGSKVWIQFAAVPLWATDGRVTGQVIVINDIDTIKRAEAALRESEAREQANRLKDEFLANMSHELRTPLNAIIGFADLMYRGKTGPLSPEHHEYLGDILTSSRHLLRLINDVLDLAKIEAGKMDIRPEAVDLEQLTGEVRDILREVAANKRLHIDLSVDEDVRGVSVDPARVKQILYNFLSNALKFTPEGGQIAVRITPEGSSQFRIEVEDTGIGIRPEHLGNLFIEFQQLDAGVAKRHQGTGLGLALTKRIAEAHGGRVDVRSVPGVGSTFSVILPRTTPSAAPAVPRNGAAAARSRGDVAHDQN